jgi:hypothetical protein
VTLMRALIKNLSARELRVHELAAEHHGGGVARLEYLAVCMQEIRLI